MPKSWVLVAIVAMIVGAVYLGRDLTPGQRVVLTLVVVAAAVWLVLQLHQLELV
jgi:hypothetical protein